MNVSNGKCIRRLSFRSLKAAKQRNIIAVISIALTSVMFTALFTIVMSMINGFEQANFRQVGGYAHGGFKYLTEEQVNELKDDKLIREYSLRRYVGMPMNEPFNKSHVEVSWCDENAAKWMFLSPEEGRLPQENTREAATDTAVLSLLGVTPEIGAEFTVTFDVDGTETTETFTLCGWWDYDEASVANNILIPESRAEEIFTKLGTKAYDGMTGLYNLDVMLKSKLHIENDMLEILARHGYQSEEKGDNYIAIGVNWGYVSAQLSDSLDAETVIALAATLILIIFTGYLIIYNVFNISVSNDIRRYGLLKTVGTTGRQIKRMVYIEALTLSAVGIPLGLVLGYLCGAVLTPVIIRQLDGIDNVVSVNPIIFVGSALFSLVTVIISCMKPARTAARVSPIEALRYTEGGSKKTVRKTKGGASIPSMAAANLGRSRSKTIITIASMSLSVVLLCITFIFTNGFDMDKYLSSQAAADYIAGDAGYFQDRAKPVSEEAVRYIEQENDNIIGGRTYFSLSAYEFVTEDYLRKRLGRWFDEEYLDNYINTVVTRDGDLVMDGTQLLGMEDLCLDKLKVLEGDISKLKTGENYIAAVYAEDDYGNAVPDSHFAKLGDKIKLCYADEWEYYNTNTGEVYPDPESIPPNEPYAPRPKTYRDVEYEVAALVCVPHTLGFRFYSNDEFVLGAENFTDNADVQGILYYAFDCTDGNTEKLESFMKDLTSNKMPSLDYESKATYAAEFESFRRMFLLLGGVLSFITALVGILNFLNAVLTGILARQHEFAAMQSIGMTGKQLKTMLVCEGLFYALGAALSALLLSLIFSPLIAKFLEDTFFFFSYKFSVMPIVITVPLFTLLGITLPLITYKFTAKKSIVERLREAE